MSKKKKIGFGILGAFITILIIVLVIPDPSTTPPAAPTVPPAAETPASLTPSPAPPPVSTKPVLAPAEQTYLTYIEGHADGMSYALGELGRLLQDSQIFNDDWKIEAATYMVLIQFGYEEAQAADCPSSMLHIHNKVCSRLIPS